MEKKENLEEVVKEVKEIDNGVNNLVTVILKDTIQDNRIQNRRLFVLNIVSLCITLIAIIFALILVYMQNVKYQEFLSQFEFGTDEVIQDLDTHEGGDITNSIITNQ